MNPRLPRSKTMRVATALTGMTACAAGFLPTAAAHAATGAGQPGKTTGSMDKKGKLVRLKVMPGPGGPGVAGPDTAAPAQPYWLNIYFKESVYSYQVCGWHPTNEWRCTAHDTDSLVSSPNLIRHVGGNKYSWDRGTIDIYWNGGGAGHWDTCNTNGAYNGQAYLGQSGHDSVSLWSSKDGGIGNGAAAC